MRVCAGWVFLGGFFPKPKRGPWEGNPSSRQRITKQAIRPRRQACFWGGA